MYVGATPTTGDFKKLDSITTSSATTFNLRQGGVAVYPQSKNHVLIILNGVLQSWDAFEIVNDTVVFSESLNSSDVINGILVLGNVNDIGTVSDDTISAAKIQTDAVTQVKIADEAIDEARMQISNAGSNGQFLSKQSGNTGGLTWAAAGGAADDYFASSGLSAKDLGDGLHIKISDTSASASTGADALVIEEDGNAGISLLSSTSGNGSIHFGDSGNNTIGRMVYRHAENSLAFETNATEALKIKQGNDNHFYKFDSTQSTEASYVMYIMSDKAEGNSSNRMIGFDNSSQGRGYIVAGDGDSDSPSFAAGSDRRLKENITNYTGGYDKIKSIPVKQWDEKYSSKKKGKIGWIADELDDVFPNAVSGTPNATKDVINSVLDKDGRLVLENTTKEEFDEKQSKGKYPNCTFHETATVPEYQYSSPLRFYADVVQALQSAITKIETLETEMTALKARVKTLEDA